MFSFYILYYYFLLKKKCKIFAICYILTLLEKKKIVIDIFSHFEMVLFIEYKFCIHVKYRKKINNGLHLNFVSSASLNYSIRLLLVC